jgi:hypothetical protein
MCMLKAMVATTGLVAALALLIAAVGLSSTSSTGYTPSAAEIWDTTIPATHTNPSQITTPTPTPPPGLLQAIATNTAPSPTPTEEPPKPTLPAIPTCPATTDRDRICSIPEPTPTPRPTGTPEPPEVLPTCGFAPSDACLMKAEKTDD